MTRRERINGLLTERLKTLEESLGHQQFTDLVAEATNDVVEYFKEKISEVIHVIGPSGQHRLIVDGKTTTWKAQNEICRNGDYVAATDFYFGQLPQVCQIKEFDAEQFMTTSQQHLAMIEIRYDKPKP
jgi:hypothetical protein